MLQMKYSVTVGQIRAYESRKPQELKKAEKSGLALITHYVVWIGLYGMMVLFVGFIDAE